MVDVVKRYEEELRELERARSELAASRRPSKAKQKELEGRIAALRARVAAEPVVAEHGRIARERQELVAAIDALSREIDEANQMASRRLKATKVAFGALVVAIAVFLSLTGTIITESTAIFQVFHADLAICAPYLTANEEELARARFASMTKREDFDAILSDFRHVAAAHNARLVQIETW